MTNEVTWGDRPGVFLMLVASTASLNSPAFSQDLRDGLVSDRKIF